MLPASQLVTTLPSRNENEVVKRFGLYHLDFTTPNAIVLPWLKLSAAQRARSTVEIFIINKKLVLLKKSGSTLRNSLNKQKFVG